MHAADEHREVHGHRGFDENPDEGEHADGHDGRARAPRDGGVGCVAVCGTQVGVVLRAACEFRSLLCAFGHRAPCHGVVVVCRRLSSFAIVHRRLPSQVVSRVRTDTLLCAVMCRLLCGGLPARVCRPVSGLQKARFARVQTLSAVPLALRTLRTLWALRVGHVFVADPMGRGASPHPARKTVILYAPGVDGVGGRMSAGSR